MKEKKRVWHVRFFSSWVYESVLVFLGVEVIRVSCEGPPHQALILSDSLAQVLDLHSLLAFNDNLRNSPD